MIKRFLLIVVCLSLLLGLLGCTVHSNEDITLPAQTSTEKPPILNDENKFPTEDTVVRAIWQDVNNVVVLWNNVPDCEYRIYRSNTPDGDFE